MFDTLRVDVIEPGDTSPCAGCSRTFALTTPQVQAGEASIGIPSEPGRTGYRARLRMYHSGATLTGSLPESLAADWPPQSVVDVTVALPEVAEEGIVDATAFLPTDAVGIPRGSLEAPESTQSGRPNPSQVGSWPGAQVVPCAGAPLEGEVCIPGGAYWMGNPLTRGTGRGDEADLRRLVVLSPFYMDATEVTVARQRAAMGSQSAQPWSGSTAGDSATDYCPFTEQPGPNEDEPVACVSLDRARQHCEARGGNLPTMAQFEYVASGLESRLFVWGRDLATCDDAVIWRVGFGMLQVSTACPTPGPPGGPEIVGNLVAPPRRDRLELPTGTVYDLVGNVSEYTLDLWNRQDEPCWSGGGVYHDPLCVNESPTDGYQITYRGGAWIGQTRFATAAGLHSYKPTGASFPIFVGFRCVRPATE